MSKIPISTEELLQKIENADEAQKRLWLEIYRNACEDRERASELYDDVLMQLKDDHTAHAVIGGQAAKYLERLNMANAQLLKLAELVEITLRKSIVDEQFTPDQIFAQIKASKGS